MTAPSRRTPHLALGLLTCLLVCLCDVASAGTGRKLQQQSGASSGTNCAACSKPESLVNASLSSKPSELFNELSATELAAADKALRSSLKLAGKGARAPSDDWLQYVELLPPPKAAALAYLEGSGSAPGRYARAIVVRGSKGDVMEYKVGPLTGDGSGAKVEELLPAGKVPFAKRPEDGSAFARAAIAQAGQGLKDVFLNMTGGRCYGSSPPCTEVDVNFFTTPTLQPDAAARISTVNWVAPLLGGGGAGLFLHTLPLTWQVDETATNGKPVRQFNFVYCHQGPYSSAADLLAAFKDGKVKTCSAAEWGKEGYDNSWAGLGATYAESGRNGAVRGSPRQCSPQGQRFSVSSLAPEGRSFQWLGWEGHAALRTATGLVLWDLRYQGKRVLYELAHQDMAVTYSGYAQPGAWFVLDSFQGMGRTSHSLKKGVDCPADALYVDGVIYSQGSGAKTTSAVMCLFEEDMATTAWRHSASDRVHNGVRAVEFVVRHVATVGNYDYVFEVRLKQDGSIEGRVTMAGVMLVSFHDPDGLTARSAPFATRVQKYVDAPLHDHLSNWKLDLDVLGTNNSFMKESVKVGTYAEALASGGATGLGGTPGWAADYPLKYLSRTRPPTELGLKVNLSEPAVWRFVNDGALNSWGEPRGYAVSVGSVSQQLLPDSHPITKAAAWTKYQLAVTVRKDAEQYSHAAQYDQYGPGQPIGSLDDLINGERIQGADLVGWVTLGVQHVTRSEDIPLIANMPTSFYIKPWNYFDDLESLEAGQADYGSQQECGGLAGVLG